MVIEASITYVFPDKSLFLIKINNGLSFLVGLRFFYYCFLVFFLRVRGDNSLINRTWSPSKVHCVS